MENLNIYTELQTNTNEKWYIEAEYLKMIFIQKNYDETIGWYESMLKALPPDDYLGDLATRYYEGCLGKVRTVENTQEILSLLTEAIRIAPASCSVLMDCHMLRAEILIKCENYLRAIADLNVCKELSGSKYHTNLQLLINFAKCFILTNNRNEAEKTIELLRVYRRKYNNIKKGKNISNNKDEKLLVSGVNNIEKLWKTIRELEKQLRKLADLRKQVNENTIDRGPLLRPYLGYTPLYPKIKNASVACSLIENSVHANRIIPAAEVILCEEPYVCELVNGKVQCSICQDNVINLISCNECHMFNYCSLECRTADQIFHKYECNGYKMMLLPLLDAKLVLRLLLRGLIFMKQKIFNLTHCQSVKNATDLFNVLLMEAHKEISFDYFRILIMDAKYEQLTPQDFEYCTMMSLRLSIYLTNFTTIIADFFTSVQLHLNHNEINIFIGALIMRHTAHIKLKKVKLTYKLPSNFVPPLKRPTSTVDESSIKDSQRAKNDDDCVLYALRVNQLQAKVQNFLSNKKRRQCKNQNDSSSTNSNTNEAQEIAQNYDKIQHNIVRTIFEKSTSLHITNKNEIFRSYVDGMYKEFFFHHNYTKSIEVPQTIRCLYPALSMFEHSCDPNCFIIVLQPGTAIVKTMRSIVAGEKLTISYGVDYRRYATDVRREFLQSRLINCKCKYCQPGDVDHSVRANTAKTFPIICGMCDGVVSFDSKPNCTFCADQIERNCTAKELLLRITETRANIEENATKYSSNAIIQAEFTILISLIEIWGKKHVDVYRQKLKLATFLANQNFVVQAYIFFKDIPIQSKIFYSDMSMELYNEHMKTLRPLFNMLEYNVKHNQSLVSKQPNLFSEIYEMIFYCVTQMLQLNDALEQCDDNDLSGLYKQVLGYKDTLNAGISSPMSAGSDTSLDGVRFYNGNIENETNARNSQSIENAFNLQNDRKLDKIRGSSDLNACMIIAEAYNSGYKYLDLFASSWSDENELCEEENKIDTDDDFSRTRLAQNDTDDINKTVEATIQPVVSNFVEETTVCYPVIKCNGHAINDVNNDILIEMNGVDGDLSMYKDEVRTNPLTKISLKL